MTLSNVFKAGIDKALASGQTPDQILNPMRAFVATSPQLRGTLRKVEEYLATHVHA